MTGPSFQMKATNVLLKVGRMINPNGLNEKQRAEMDRYGKLVGGSTSGSIVEEIKLGEIEIDIIRQRLSNESAAPSAEFPAANKWVLHFHGGAFVTGSAVSHRGLCYRIGQAVGQDCNVMVPDYRLAPEHPSPAALDDAIACYEYLLRQAVPADHVVVSGDSAGGNLALSLVLRLKEEGKPLPKALVLISPWVDLTCSLDAYTSKQGDDPLLVTARLKEAAKKYAGDQALDSPGISPLNANLSGLPPMLIQYGTAEILHSDSVELGKKVTEAGGSVELQEYPGAIHDWQFFAYLPEATKAVNDIAAFINAKLGN